MKSDSIWRNGGKHFHNSFSNWTDDYTTFATQQCCATASKSHVVTKLHWKKNQTVGGHASLLHQYCTHLLQRTGCHLRCVNYAGSHVFCVFCFQYGFVNCISAIEASCVCSDGWLCRCIRLLVQRWWIRLTWRRIGLIRGRTRKGVCGRMWISWCWRWRTVRLRWTILFDWNILIWLEIPVLWHAGCFYSLFIILYDSISGLAAGTSLKSSSSLNHISSSSSNCRWSRRYLMFRIIGMLKWLNLVLFLYFCADQQPYSPI